MNEDGEISINPFPWFSAAALICSLACHLYEVENSMLPEMMFTASAIGALMNGFSAAVNTTKLIGQMNAVVVIRGDEESA